MLNKFISVIIPAAGSGKRMNSSVAKQYLKIDGKTILYHTINAFQNASIINEIIVVSPENDINTLKKTLTDFSKLRSITVGGKERQDSVLNGLSSVSKQADIILVHDGVRPFINESEIIAICKELENEDAAVLAVPVKNTIKVVKDNIVDHTPKRSDLWAIQTPQGMKANIFRSCYTSLKNEDFLGTDESMIAEYYGYKVKVVKGDYKNIKITTPEDLEIAEVFYKGRTT